MIVAPFLIDETEFMRTQLCGRNYADAILGIGSGALAISAWMKSSSKSRFRS
jgi:hypothetical protein